MISSVLCYDSRASHWVLYSAEGIQVLCICKSEDMICAMLLSDHAICNRPSFLNVMKYVFCFAQDLMLH